MPILIRRVQVARAAAITSGDDSTERSFWKWISASHTASRPRSSAAFICARDSSNATWSSVPAGDSNSVKRPNSISSSLPRVALSYTTVERPGHGGRVTMAQRKTAPRKRGAREQGQYERGLDKVPANYVPLTPLSFLARSASVYPQKTAVIHGERSFTYAELYARCRRLASALARRGIGLGDTVAIMAPNVPALLEAHYGVPMTGAVLNALDYRLDARTIAFILDHADAKLLITDREFSETIRQALELLGRSIPVIDIDDPLHEGGTLLGEKDYEALLAEGDPEFDWGGPADEWQAICLLYTSGTTGDPKGVVYHHRGAYLNALGNALAFGLGPRSVYLWTLPMFHCSGWTYTWAVTAAGGTHVCLRRVDPALIFPAIGRHRVTHMCGAPIVMTMLIHAPAELKTRFDHTVEMATGGAAPPSAVIAAMEAMGFRVTHLYGLTETFGPSTLCAWQS